MSSADHQEHKLTWELFKAYHNMLFPDASEQSNRQRLKNNTKDLIGKFIRKGDKAENHEVKTDNEVWMTRFKEDGTVETGKVPVKNGVAKFDLKAGECAAITTLKRNKDGSADLIKTDLTGFDQETLNSKTPEGVFVKKSFEGGSYRYQRAETIGECLNAYASETAMAAATNKKAFPGDAVKDCSNPKGGVYKLKERHGGKNYMRLVMMKPAKLTGALASLPVVEGILRKFTKADGQYDLNDMSRYGDSQIFESNERIERAFGSTTKNESDAWMKTGRIPDKNEWERIADRKLGGGVAASMGNASPATAKMAAPEKKLKEPSPTGIAAPRSISIASKKSLVDAIEKNDLSMINAHMKRGIDANTVNKETGRPIIFECQSGEAQNLLLENGADPNIKNNMGRTPLHLACEKQDIEQAKLLLKHGADPLVLDNKGNTPHEHGTKTVPSDIAEQERQKEFSSEFKKAAAEAATRKLREAVKNNDYDLANECLERGANPNKTDKPGVAAPLHDSKDAKMTELLLQNGADPNIKNILGDTPLHKACAELDNGQAETLLKYGANENIKNDMGETPYQLLKYRPTEKDEEKRETLRHTLEKDTWKKDDQKRDLEQGKDTSPENAALFDAVFKRDAKGVEDAIQKGADPNCKNEHGLSPLSFAVKDSDDKTTLALLQNGANPNIRDDVHSTPLHFAAMEGNSKNVDALLSFGADPNSKNINGVKPADYSLDNKPLAKKLKDASETIKERDKQMNAKAPAPILDALIAAPKKLKI